MNEGVQRRGDEVSRGEMTRRRSACAIVTVVATLSLAAMGGAWAGAQQQKIRISQKDQAFQPGNITIKQGDVVDVANDDDDVLHHAYVDSDKFKFDSGDQEPGTTVEIKFSVTGTFTVLCGIHPKMKLKVHVE